MIFPLIYACPLKQMTSYFVSQSRIILIACSNDVFGPYKNFVSYPKETI